MTTEVDPKQDPRFKAATLALSDVQRAIRFIHLYPHDHPFCTKALDDVVAHLETFFATYGALVIDVTREGIALDEVVILKDQNQSTDLSALLYPEGVRQISIQPAVTRQEILDLVQILAARYAEHESREQGGVDLMTALWRRDFHHIACHVQDDLSPTSVNSQREEGLAPIAKRIVLLAGSIARGYDEAHSLETGSFVTRREDFRRKGLLDAGSGANFGAFPEPPPEFQLTELATARAKLVLETIDPSRTQIIDRVSRLLLWAARRKEGAPGCEDLARFASGAALGLLSQGEVKRAIDLVTSLLKGYPDREALVSALSEKLARERGLALLSQAIEKLASKHGAETAGAVATSYLSILDAPAVRKVCTYYGSMDREEPRRAFRAFLVARAKADPEAVAELTLHKNRAVAVEGFKLLADAGKDGRGWQILEQAMKDTANAPRASAAQEAYDAATGVKQRRELMTILESGSDKAKRLEAAQKLTVEVAGPKAFDELSALVQTAAFGKRDEDEIEAVLAAFTRVGRLRCVRVLSELTTRKTGLFGRKGARGISQIAQEQLLALKSLNATTTRESTRLSAAPSSGSIPVAVNPSSRRTVELVKKLTDNPDRVNRAGALRELLALKAPRTFDDLSTIALGPDFCMREQDEIVELLAAIADLGKLKATKVFQELAARKVGVFRRAETQRLVTLAQEALAGLKGW